MCYGRVLWQPEAFIKGLGCSPPPCVRLPGGSPKGANSPSCLFSMLSVLFASFFFTNHEKQCNGFPSFFPRVVCSNAYKHLNKAGKAIPLSFLVAKEAWWNLKCHRSNKQWRWAFLALHWKEAARGALTRPEFQNMPDPLDPYGPVVKEEDVSTPFTVLTTVFVFVYCVKHVEQWIVYCTVLIFRTEMPKERAKVGLSWGRIWGWWL